MSADYDPELVRLRFRRRVREALRGDRAGKPRARRLPAIAKWINENRPELVATVERVRVSTDRKIGRLRWPGKGREGNRIIVKRKHGGAVLLDHNGAETYRRNDEVEAWLAKYLAERKR